LLAQAKQEALVVVDETGRPIGIVTETDLVTRAATGDVPLDAPVEALMSRPVLTAPPGLSAGEVVLRMMRRHVRHVIVTADGTPGSAVEGLIGQRDLQLLYGRLPTALGLEIRSARNRTTLADLRDRADVLLRTALQERAPLSWAGDFISEVDGQITGRLLELAEGELTGEGLKRPRGTYCWLALGAEGRRERFLRTYQETALLYEDPAPGEETATQTWYLNLAERVSTWLAELGFRASPDGLSAAQGGCCRSLSGWRALFTTWIENPVEENILSRLPVFDLRAVAGDANLAAALREHLLQEVAGNPRFIPLAANDSLASLPPLTIFRNSVVDKDGLWWTCIDTRQHALQPLVDTARVFALEAAGPDPLNTSARFLQAARRLPAHRVLFEDAAEAARAALYHQALAGFRHGDNGQFIRPSELSKIDLEILKGVFREIVQVIEFTSRHFGLAPTPPEEKPAEAEAETATAKTG
jgi:CBS domain-containing protein